MRFDRRPFPIWNHNTTPSLGAAAPGSTSTTSGINRWPELHAFQRALAEFLHSRSRTAKLFKNEYSFFASIAMLSMLIFGRGFRTSFDVADAIAQ